MESVGRGAKHTLAGVHMEVVVPELCEELAVMLQVSLGGAAGHQEALDVAVTVAFIRSRGKRRALAKIPKRVCGELQCA